MEEYSQIFKEADALQIAILAKRVRTARIVAYALGVLYISICLLTLTLSFFTGVDNHNLINIIFFGIISVIFFASAIFSTTRPFVALLTASIITVLMTAFYFYLTITAKQSDVGALFTSFIISHIVLSYFLIRGIVSSKKHKELTDTIHKSL